MVQAAAGSVAGGGHLLGSLFGIHPHMPEGRSHRARPVTDPALELCLFSPAYEVQGLGKLLSYFLLPGPCGKGNSEGSRLRDGHGAAKCSNPPAHPAVL